MQLEYFESLIGIAQLAVALAGFSGVVVVFGSMKKGGWHPGDRLRLGFLIESSLTAAAFSLIALILLYWFNEDPNTSWIITSSLWSIFMVWSLYSSHARIQVNKQTHDDIDQFANRLVTFIFSLLILLQIYNSLVIKEFWPLLAALVFNLTGATMQFVRLIKSAFHD